MKKELIDSINENIRSIVMSMLEELDKHDFKAETDKEKIETALMSTAGYVKENGQLKVLKVKDNKLEFEEVEIVASLNDVIKNYVDCLTFSQNEKVNKADDIFIEFVRAQMPASIQEEATIDDIIKYAKEYK